MWLQTHKYTSPLPCRVHIYPFLRQDQDAQSNNMWYGAMHRWFLNSCANMWTFVLPYMTVCFWRPPHIMIIGVLVTNATRCWGQGPEKGSTKKRKGGWNVPVCRIWFVDTRNAERIYFSETRCVFGRTVTLYLHSSGDLLSGYDISHIISDAGYYVCEISPRIVTYAVRHDDLQKKIDNM